MAQDPESSGSSVDPSHDFDMTPLYDSSTIDAEIEAGVIRGILDANGVPSVLVAGSAYMPNLGFQVQVPRARLEEARRLIAEAQAAGPEAAAEAEAATENERN